MFLTQAAGKVITFLNGFLAARLRWMMASFFLIFLTTWKINPFFLLQICQCFVLQKKSAMEKDKSGIKKKLSPFQIKVFTFIVHIFAFWQNKSISMLSRYRRLKVNFFSKVWKKEIKVFTVILLGYKIFSQKSIWPGLQSD